MNLCMLSSEEIAGVKTLKENGYSLKDIEEKTGFSIPTIIKYTKGVKKKRKKPSNSPPPSGPQLEEENNQNLELPEDSPENSTLELPIDQNIEPIVDDREALIEVKGLPVGKTIQLTPVNYTMWQWFRTRYQFVGDISDFVNDCMDWFFKDCVHAKMKIDITEELS